MSAAKANQPPQSPRPPKPASPPPASKNPTASFPPSTPAPRAATTNPPASPAKPSPPPATPKISLGPVTPWWKPVLAILVILGAGLLTYSNCFQGEFALDDLPAITDNHTIQFTDRTSVLKGWFASLFPPNEGQTVTDRPAVNLSFAANFRWNATHGGNGLDPWGYHATNLAIHLLAALALFGLIRRTFELPKLRVLWPGASVPLAGAATLLWMLHPLQTESVTYVAQRAESLMGLFYFTTFYCFVRGTQFRSWLWFPLAGLSCLIGVFCKEVTITAPVMILLFDIIFVAEKPRDAVVRRWPVYVAFLFAMALQTAMALIAGNRGGSAGFGTGLTWYDYAMAQFPNILHYLWLTVWPHPLVLYYGESEDQIQNNPGLMADSIPAMLVVMALVALTVWLLWKRPKLGFLAAWFFVILAPSSSVVPITTEIAAEHRVYLPLAALAVLAVVGLYSWLGRRGLWASLTLACALGAVTHARNLDYRNGLSLWEDTTGKRPDIARAHNNFGISLIGAGRYKEAVQEFFSAIKLRPFYPDCENNLGNALAQLGRNEEATVHYERAIRGLGRVGDRAQAYYNLANAERGIAEAQPNPTQDPHMQLALNHLLVATQLDPNYVGALHNIGSLLSENGRYDDAIKYYLQAIQVQPNFPQAEINLANTYNLAGRPADAIQHLQHATQEQPGNALAHLRLGGIYYDTGNYAGAAQEFGFTAQLVPADPKARFYLANALVKLGRREEAAREYQAALARDPSLTDAQAALNQLLQQGVKPAP